MKLNICGTSLQTCDIEERCELRGNFTHADTRQICGPHFLMPGNKLASSRSKAAASDSESEAPEQMARSWRRYASANFSAVQMIKLVLRY